MCLSHQCDGLAATLAAALAAGKPALDSAQVRQLALQMPGIVDLGAIRENRKAVQTNVNPDVLRRLRQGDRVPIDRKTHVPVIYIPLDRHRFDLALNRPVQLDFDDTSALDTQLAFIEQTAAVAIGRKGDAVVPVEGTEARKTGIGAAFHPREESLEGLIQTAQHILAAGEVCQPDESFGPHLLQLIRLVVVADALPADLPGVAPFLKPGVIQIAGFVELTLEKLNLSSGRVEAVFISKAHLLSFLGLDVFAHHGFTHRADRASVVAAAP